MNRWLRLRRMLTDLDRLRLSFNLLEPASVLPREVAETQMMQLEQAIDAEIDRATADLLRRDLERKQRESAA